MKRVLAFERVRATTLKSTFVFPLVGAAVAWAASVLFISMGADVDEVAIASFIGQAFTPISAVFLTIPFAQAFGHDYRDGTMRLALSEFPQRSRLFAAKLIVPAVIAFVSTVITIAGVAMIAFSGPSFGFAEITGLDGLPGIAMREAVFVVLWGLLVASVTLLSRNMAAGVAGVLIWGLIAENLLAIFLIERIPVLAEIFPISQGFGWVQTGQPALILPMIVVSAVLTLVAYVKFVRSDA